MLYLRKFPTQKAAASLILNIMILFTACHSSKLHTDEVGSSINEFITLGVASFQTNIRSNQKTVILTTMLTKFFIQVISLSYPKIILTTSQTFFFFFEIRFENQQNPSDNSSWENYKMPPEQ